jgi:hypothetical protein
VAPARHWRVSASTPDAADRSVSVTHGQARTQISGDRVALDVEARVEADLEDLTIETGAGVRPPAAQLAGGCTVAEPRKQVPTI